MRCRRSIFAASAVLLLAASPAALGAGGPIAYPGWSVAPFAIMLIGVALGPTLLA